MADLLNVGARALNSFQTAIDTTGNNIVNANTEGYSRQTVNFAAQEGQYSGNAYIGNGVSVDSIQRVYDQLLHSEVLTRSASQSATSSLFSMSSQLESLFSEPYYGVQSSLDSYQSALNDLANNPSSIPERQVALSEAENLVNRLQSLGQSLEMLDTQVRDQIQADLDSINQLSIHIAEINSTIENSPSGAGAPNELLDQRDILLKELSTKISIDTVIQDSGSVAVYLENGNSLVNGLQSSTLELRRDEFGAGIEISQPGLSGSLSASALMAGGSLGGALQFQQDVLQPAMQDFGLMSLTLAAASNEQQSLGLDLNGNIGAELFQVPEINAAQSIHNLGTATVSIDLVDYTQLESGSYELTYDGTDWTLTNLDSGATQTGASPLTMGGIDVNVSGTAVAGDRFLIQPSLSSLGEVQLAMTDPNGIAASTIIRTETSITNLGNAAVSDTNIVDSSMLPLVADIQLTFDGNALGAGIPGFFVSGLAAGPLAYDPATDANGVTFTLSGVEVEISGTPSDGDQLQVLNNTGATGDNTNALALADILDVKVLSSSNQSLQDINASLLAFMGSKAAAASSSLNIENTLLNNAEQSLASINGVNLDEEAADLLRFQQAYQAAAQLISVAETLFDTLLNATRR